MKIWPSRCLSGLLVLALITLLESQRRLAAEPRSPLKIVMLGDSITRGVRPGVVAEQTFASLLQSELLKTGRTVEVVNVGIGGEKTSGALARLDKDVIARQPDLVTIMYGTNDSYVYPNKQEPDLSREEYVANLQQLVERLRAAGIVPILMTPPRWGDKAANNGIGQNPNVRLEAYVVGCREIAKKLNVPLVDHFAQWSSRNSEGFDIGEWTTDQCHLNPAGHKVVAASILNVLRREKLVSAAAPAE